MDGIDYSSYGLLKLADWANLEVATIDWIAKGGSGQVESEETWSEKRPIS
jgi:hypothetical protein